MQWKKVMLKRRNTFLADVLEIPPDRWGFSDDEWGGVMPEIDLMQQHFSCLAKRRLASVWTSRDTIRRVESEAEFQRSVTPAASEGSEIPPPPPHGMKVQLESPESV